MRWYVPEPFPRGFFRSSLITAGLLSLMAGPVFGQASSGQIKGRVIDAATGTPIAGVEVIVAGTTFGNLTNDDGFYFINGVPAGLHTIRATFIGYRTVAVTDERILAGHTTTMDFQLAATAVEQELLIIEGDRSPLVRSVVPGEMVDQLPLDNAAGIVVLQPGVVRTNQGRTIRGGRPNEEAVLINGVLSRGFGRGISDNIALPTNSLEQVEVNVGVFSAEFGEAQSGIVSFVTRSGGKSLTGSLELMSDQLGPDNWRTNFNRAEFTLGGPIAGPLTFFLAGTASGQDASRTENAPPVFVTSGFDTCDVENFCETANGGPGLGAPATFRLPRSSATPGVSDFVDVTAPTFAEFDNGRTVPNGWSQSDLFHGNLNWQLPRGSRINFSFNRNRNQGMGHDGFTSNFLFDGVDGVLSTRNSYALSLFHTLKRTADEQISLDVLVAFSQDRNTSGMLDQQWWLDNLDPTFGFLTSNVNFAFDDVDRTVAGFDAFDPSEEFINAYRSNAVPRDSMMLFPGRIDLVSTSQSLTGLSRNLRSNPYGLRTLIPLNGAGSNGLTKSSEDRLQLRGSLDWQLGRSHRIKVGAEYFAIELDAFSLPLFTNGLPVPETADPRKVGVFLQDRLDIGDLILEAGVRYDRLDTDAEYSRTPGFVFNVPDSLKAGFVRFDANTGDFNPLFTTPCGGVTATNPNGTCLNNFLEAETKSEFSPRVGASYALSPTSTFRLSYGRFVQTPSFFTPAPLQSVAAGVLPGNLGVLQNANSDLQNGSSGATFARDVDMPSTRIMELGYRLLIGDDLVMDISAFNKRRSGALISQSRTFSDPTRPGATIFVDVLANADSEDFSGFEIAADKSVGNMIRNRLSYSFVDDQNHRHNINWTGSLSLPSDYQEGRVLGAILRNVNLFTILRVRSGLPFTRLANQGGGQVGPPSLSGIPAGGVNDSSTPWTVEFDIRLAKAFQVGNGVGLQVFVDWRNPFDIENNPFVFLETGSEVNELFRTATLATTLRDSQLDGDANVDDFDIRSESPENPFNVFMLLRAEQRFGNGDGIFTVAEQETAFGQIFENNFGANSLFKTSDQLMRLGFRIAF